MVFLSGFPIEIVPCFFTRLGENQDLQIADCGGVGKEGTETEAKERT